MQCTKNLQIEPNLKISGSLNPVSTRLHNLHCNKFIIFFTSSSLCYFNGFPARSICKKMCKILKFKYKYSIILELKLYYLHVHENRRRSYKQFFPTRTPSPTLLILLFLINIARAPCMTSDSTIQPHNHAPQSNTFDSQSPSYFYSIQSTRTSLRQDFTRILVMCWATARPLPRTP